MRPVDDGHDRRGAQGGIPDGLLLGILAFLLGMTLLVWTATGLAALFSHGAWPDGVTFTHTPWPCATSSADRTTSRAPGPTPPPTHSPATASSGACSSAS